MRKAIQDAKLPYTYVIAYGAGLDGGALPYLASQSGRPPFVASADSCMTGIVPRIRAL